jgi:hypothetical protein
MWSLQNRCLRACLSCPIVERCRTRLLRQPRGKLDGHSVARLRESTPDDGIEGIPSIDEQWRNCRVGELCSRYQRAEAKVLVNQQSWPQDLWIVVDKLAGSVRLGIDGGQVPSSCRQGPGTWMMPQPRPTTRPPPKDLGKRMARRTDRSNVQRGDFSRDAAWCLDKYSIID